MRIERKEGAPRELSIKRLYLPFTVISNCPSCGSECSTDLSDYGMMYPTPGKPTGVYFVCQNTQAHNDDGFYEWDERVVFDFTLKAAGENV